VRSTHVRQPCASSMSCHCCPHPFCARYMYDEDTPDRQRANPTPLRLRSVEAWMAVWNGPTAALNTKPAVKVLYEWYKILTDCVARGVVPDRVQQVRMHCCCVCYRYVQLAQLMSWLRTLALQGMRTPRAHYARDAHNPSGSLACSQQLYHDAFCPAQMVDAPGKALHQAAARSAITDVGRQSSQGSGQLRCVACCVSPQCTVRTRSLLHPQTCDIGVRRTSLTMC
jgi:hypothetical protein